MLYTTSLTPHTNPLFLGVCHTSLYPSNPIFFLSLSLSTTMKTTQQPPPKQLKPPNRTASLFSCAFFRNCTDTPLSPTLPPPPPPSHHPPPPPPPPSHHRPLLHKPSDSESSSSSTSQSFTQWRFPPTFHHPHSDSFPATPPPPPPTQPPTTPPTPLPPPLPIADLREIFHVAELHFTSGSDSDRLSALHMMERSLVPNPPSDAVSGDGRIDGAVVVPTVVMSGVIEYLKDKAVAKSATKILLALCLAEGNRRVAVECQAAARVVDVLPDLEGTVAERALAALDLMCTVPEGAAEVRAHALAVPMLVAVMGRMEGRGREYTISVLSAVYGGCGGGDSQLGAVAPAEEVGRAVVLAMQQGDCSARAKRKGAQLLKTLEDNGRLDLTQDP